MRRRCPGCCWGSWGCFPGWCWGVLMSPWCSSPHRKESSLDLSPTNRTGSYTAWGESPLWPAGDKPEINVWYKWRGPQETMGCAQYFPRVSVIYSENNRLENNQDLTVTFSKAITKLLRPAACHCSERQTRRHRWHLWGVCRGEASLGTSPPPCRAYSGLGWTK